MAGAVDVVVVGEVVAPDRASAELGVVDLDAGVDDVDAGSRAVRRVTDVAGVSPVSVRDSGDAVGGAVLGRVVGQVELLVFLDILDLNRGS